MPILFSTLLMNCFNSMLFVHIGLCEKWEICFNRFQIHYDAKLCILCIVCGFHNKDAPLFFFCSLLSFDSSDKNLTCLRTCLWIPGTYRPKLCAHPVHSLAPYCQFKLITLSFFLSCWSYLCQDVCSFKHFFSRDHKKFLPELKLNG